MPKGFYKDIIAELKLLGFEYEKNAKGSHEVWVKKATGRRLLVPRSTKSRHTANGIMKDAEAEKRF